MYSIVSSESSGLGNICQAALKSPVDDKVTVLNTNPRMIYNVWLLTIKSASNFKKRFLQTRLSIEISDDKWIVKKDFCISAWLEKWSR